MAANCERELVSPNPGSANHVAEPVARRILLWKSDIRYQKHEFRQKLGDGQLGRCRVGGHLTANCGPQSWRPTGRQLGRQLSPREIWTCDAKPSWRPNWPSHVGRLPTRMKLPMPPNRRQTVPPNGGSANHVAEPDARGILLCPNEIRSPKQEFSQKLGDVQLDRCRVGGQLAAICQRKSCRVTAENRVGGQLARKRSNL